MQNENASEKSEAFLNGLVTFITLLGRLHRLRSREFRW